MGTGMVLIIVMRHIDLSVGSSSASSPRSSASCRCGSCPVYLGLDSPTIWILAVILALVVGAAIGALHGSLVAYIGIPAFIVTLGGAIVLARRGWWVTTGQTIAPLDGRFALMGGGPHGSIGATWSWIIALVCCVGIVFSLYAGRRGARGFASHSGRCGRKR